MATVKVVLHPTNKNKEGKRSIVLRLTSNRIKNFIDLGFDVKLDKTQFSEGQIKANSGVKNRNKINAVITKKFAEAQDVLLELERKNIPVTFESFKKHFLKKKTKDFVIPYFDAFIEELQEKGKAGNADMYKTVRNSVSNFRKNKQLRFSDIDMNFLGAYERFMFKSGMSGNAVSTYMRTLRALLNKAIGDGIADQSLYPFKNNFNPNGYQISDLETNTNKRALALGEIQKIISYETKELTPIHDAKMYFLFSFLARGMNFTDMAYLKQENINNDRIYYTRAKTRGKQSTSFKILPQMKEIMDYFEIHPGKADYIFPILNSENHKTPQQKRARIKTVLRRVNRKLKDIGNATEISIPLTTYVTRHSWATIQKFMGESEALISEGLLHSNVRTTQIYLKQFENTPLDEMNERLAGKLFA